jgi:hypothetical protein
MFSMCGTKRANHCDERNGILAIVDDKGREKERYQVIYGARITVADGDPVKANMGSAGMGYL